MGVKGSRPVSERRFWEHYKPIESITGNQMWEYHEVIASGVPLNRIWTVIEGDTGRTWYASPGFHIVNKLGYVVTEVPWEDATIDAIYDRH